MSEKIKQKVRKKWGLKTLNDKRKWFFFPTFEVKDSEEESHGVATATDKDVECTTIEIQYTDEKGEQVKGVFNYLDLYMLIYFCANEELRQQLQMRYERDVNYIPYDVAIRIDKEEMKTGIVKRRIELPIDELTMAIARNEAMKGKGMEVLPNMVKNTPQGPRIMSKGRDNDKGGLINNNS